MRQLLICTDLDRTLLPNGPQEESPEARRYFAALAARPETVIAYVSGRHRELVTRAIDEWALPNPDFVVGDVGTSIYRLQAGGTWRRQSDWDSNIGRDWRGNSSRELALLLEGIDELTLQEAQKQGRHKLSYYAPLACDPEMLSDTVEKRLSREGVAARQVWSIDEPEGVRLLDVLPERASKYHAIRAVMDRLGIGEDATVFCGDSGNDIDVLVSPLRSVLVRNAAPEVREQALQMASEAGNAQHLYIAHGGFLGMNGHFAAGMLEGIAHYFPSTVAWLGTSADVV